MALTIREICRYPVKSLGGEVIETANVGVHGIEGDRQWGIRDLATDLILTARREPELLMASSRFFEGGVAIRLPDGRDTDDDADLSSWLGRDVALVRASKDAGGTFENPMDAENDADWISWTGPSGSLHDSTKTMLSLASTLTIGGWDRRRFRKNLIAEGSGEDELVGRIVQIGSCSASVTKKIDRCVMVTRPQPGFERDLDVLRTINKSRDRRLGIGMLITEPGVIAVGDQVIAL
ncbi:MAG: MOSC N-terminal beta barrel domain-containing protein [Acidimicrobiales bacterium]